MCSLSYCGYCTGLDSIFIRPMYLLTFDEDTAHVDGLPVRLMSVLFNIVTGIAIALMIPAAGSLLVSTIMILPAAIGMKIGQTFKSVIFWLLVLVWLACFLVSLFPIIGKHQLVQPLPLSSSPSLAWYPSLNLS